MPAETFAAARTRLLGELAARGWTTRPGLKEPWAEPPNGGLRLRFRPQAVYLDEHSLWIDIRGLSVEALLAHVKRAMAARQAYGNAARFKISARPTRGGYRGVARAHNGAVALKTMPVFREKKDAQDAIRAWLKEHGAHADRRRTMQASRRIPYRERKFIPKHMYALPERAPGRGALPLADPRHPDRYDPAHVRNAAARLAQMHKRHSVTLSEFRRAERAIIRAACAVGVERTCRRHLAQVIPISRARESRETHETRLAAYSRSRRTR